MKCRSLIAFALTALLSGCATQYGPKGFNGGYSDEKIDSTSYYIRYDGPPLPGLLVKTEEIARQWERRANELCGSDDYYKETKSVRLDQYGRQDDLIGIPSVMGIVYCNNKFVDTRNKDREESFRRFIELPDEALAYKDVSPLWGLLINGKYSDLEKELNRLRAVLSDEELDLALETFSRVIPEAEQNLNEWIAHFPESFWAYYARASYYHSYSWFERSNQTWDKVTEKQKASFFKYQSLAVQNLAQTLELNPQFCSSHALGLTIHTAVAESKGAIYDTFLEEALGVCPEFMGVRVAHLRNLLPRWHGSLEKMRLFINTSREANNRFDVLEALYVMEEADQFLFNGEDEKAAEKYSQAAELGTFSGIFLGRAEAYDNLERYVDAIDDLQVALNLSPYRASTYYHLITLLSKSNKLLEALIASSYYIAMNNQHPSIYEGRGNILYEMRRYHDALLNYQFALDRSPEKKAKLRHKIRMTEFQIEVRKGEEKAMPADIPI